MIALVVSLIAAAPAAGKGLRWIELCGPSECERTQGEDVLGQPLIFPPWVMMGAPDGAPKQEARWLRVRVSMRGNKRPLRSVVVPGIGYAGGTEGREWGFIWERMGRDVRATYRELGRGVERYPASTMPGSPSSSSADPLAVPAERPLSLTVAAAVGRTASVLVG